MLAGLGEEAVTVRKSHKIRTPRSDALHCRASADAVVAPSAMCVNRSRSMAPLRVMER